MSSPHPELWKTLRWFALLVALVLLAWLGLRTFERGVGGTVTIGANQAEGTYTGTFTVLAQYN